MILPRSQKTFYNFINPSQLQQLQTALKRHFGSTVAWRVMVREEDKMPVKKVRKRNCLKGKGLKYIHHKQVILDSYYIS